jgi:DNA-binding response OmpR family regulator
MTGSVKRILIIEDDEDISTLLANRLRKEGYVVEFACDGEKGLNRIEELRPDLIILDLMLPSVPGEVICKEVRSNKDPQISKVPVIMLTAKGSTADKFIGKGIGANLYVTKPFDAAVLLSEVRRLFGH